MIIMCAPAVRERLSAWLRLARTDSSSSENTVSANWRGAMLISMLNCPSSVWKSGSAIASSTAALASAAGRRRR